VLEVSDRDRGQRSAQPSVLTGYEGRNMLASPSRIAFSTLAFPEVTLATAVSLGRSWGYAGVELRLVDGELIEGSMPAATRTEVKRTVAAASLPIVAVDSSIRLTGDDPGPELRQFLELASDWEAPLVRVFGGALPVDEHAERLGVAVGVETHDAFSASSVVAELLAMVDSPWVGAVWDSHHPHRMDEQPAEIYQNIGRRTLLAQVKDARRAPAREDGWQLVLLGEGEVPVREMLRLLAAGGYEGWISVEWEKRWHPEIEEPQVALPQHLKLLETWMHELEEAG